MLSGSLATTAWCMGKVHVTPFLVSNDLGIRNCANSYISEQVTFIICRTCAAAPKVTK
jgi:hypothetical protein